MLAVLIGMVTALIFALYHAIKKLGAAEERDEVTQKENAVLENEANIGRTLVSDDDIAKLLRDKADKARQHESKGNKRLH